MITKNHFKTGSKNLVTKTKLVKFEKIKNLMIVLDGKISIGQLSALAENLYGDMIKAVADVRNNLLAVDAELHSDLERLLLENGSEQEDLWGFNIYPDMQGEDFIEFDSLINIRPRQNNRSCDVEDAEVRRQIVDIVDKFIER